MTTFWHKYLAYLMSFSTPVGVGLLLLLYALNPPTNADIGTGIVFGFIILCILLVGLIGLAILPPQFASFRKKFVLIHIPVTTVLLTFSGFSFKTLFTDLFIWRDYYGNRDYIGPIVQNIVGYLIMILFIFLLHKAGNYVLLKALATIARNQQKNNLNK